MMTGLHSVTITGNTDNGATFTSGWSFRIDAGSVSDYTSTSFTGGALGYNYGSGPFGFGGWGGLGWPVHGFGPFGLVAHNQDRLPEGGCLFLDTARVG